MGPAAATTADDVPVTHFEITVGAAETSGDSAIINTDATNGQRHDLLFVTPNPYRGETCPCLAVPPLPVIGVRYTGTQWAVFDENKTAMPDGETFNVLAVPASARGAFTVSATKANTQGDHTFISSPLTNGKPAAIIQLTQNRSPDGKSTGAYNPHLVGVRYYRTQRKWAILNESGASMPRRAAFNVLVGTTATGGGTATVAKTTAASRVGAATLVSDPTANDDSSAVLFVTPDYNPHGKGGTTSLSPTAVSYDTPAERWAVGDENHTPVPLHSAYDLLSYPAAQMPLTHFEISVTAAETGGDSAVIDDAATNGQPGDLLFVIPNPYRGETCPCLAVAPLPVIGVWYDGTQWAVFDENQSAMPDDESFNVLAEPVAGAGVFVHTATKANTQGDHTLINSPATNGKPGAVLQVTQNWNPGGKPTGVYNPHLVGVRYYRAQRKWAIVNEDGAAIPSGAAFNVLVGGGASGGGTATVATATAASKTGAATLVSDPAANGDSGAVLFVTPDYNPGGKGGTTSLSPTSLIYDTPKKRWAVYDENLTPVPLHSAYNLLIFAG